jgi:four helix bundle protein
MAGFRDFREIVAWQLAHQLKVLVDAYLNRPEFKLRYKFREQLDDAVRSAPRNIAEGFARYKHKEFAQFVRIAKGSEAEVLNHLIDARDQRLITNDEFLYSEHLVKRALKAANGLIRFLESNPDPPAPRANPKAKRHP